VSLFRDSPAAKKEAPGGQEAGFLARILKWYLLTRRKE
jgi:hypothetical protein